MQQSIDLARQASGDKPESELNERELRIQLAAAYRLIDHFRMTDLTETHLSVRLPGSADHFLLNPHGMLFHEITASSLVKVDLQGNIVEYSDWPVNPAGFVIHSAIHTSRKDLTCVMHTHSRYGTAVSTLECGLLPISQFALQFYDRVAYHDYEGVSLDLGERERLVNDLGDKNVMILRNHGLLTAGSSIAEAFYLMFYLERACEVQILAQSSVSKLIIPSATVCKHSASQQAGGALGQLQWQALLRMLDRQDPSYRD
jgi:ribulose-5-phosphate 4-epimerase/fuculose-1-phosphate aldolase